ncbi:MAG: hypothetical protein IJX51_00525 [Clostridia bacterium]|nr:hypothetical protein [Clostridia bacterium]
MHKRIPFFSANEIDIELCSSVPRQFIDAIEGKELVYFRKSKYASPEIHYTDRKSIGKFDQSFMDEVARQISMQLILLSGCELSPKWGIVMGERKITVNIDNKNYCEFTLSNSIAECIRIGVCWVGKSDVCDYVGKDSVEFQLTEYKFNERISSFEKIKEFIKNKGFIYT